MKYAQSKVKYSSFVLSGFATLLKKNNILKKKKKSGLNAIAEVTSHLSLRYGHCRERK